MESGLGERDVCSEEKGSWWGTAGHGGLLGVEGQEDIENEERGGEEKTAEEERQWVAHGKSIRISILRTSIHSGSSHWPTGILRGTAGRTPWPSSCRGGQPGERRTQRARRTPAAR